MYDKENEPTIMGQALPKAMFVVRQGTQAGMSFPLTTRQATLGREEGIDIVLQDPESSRRHARVNWHKGEFVLEDLGSTNGTFVNGVQITKSQILNPGDSVGIGQTTLVFQMVGAAGLPPYQAPQQTPIYSGPTGQILSTKNENQMLKYSLYGFGCLLLFCICFIVGIITWVVIDPQLFEDVTGFHLTLTIIETYFA